MNRLVAIAVAMLSVAQAARGGDEAAEPVHVYVADVPAPPLYATMIWRSPDGVETAGFWFTEPAIVRTDARLRYLERQAAEECFNKTVEADKAFLTSRSGFWLAGGIGVALGIGLGIFIHQRVTR